MEDFWPFDQAENVATITTRQVLREGFPILRVVHYLDDHSWSFTCGTTDNIDDAMVVSMKRMVEHDSSLFQLADLPPGFGASREDINSPWKRHKIQD